MSKYSPGDLLLVQPHASFMFAAIVTGEEEDGRLIIRCIDAEFGDGIRCQSRTLTIRSGWHVTQLTAAEIETAATRSHP